MDIAQLASDTVKEYYQMREDQREFITNLIDSSGSIKWSRIELMRALMLYNKSYELGCILMDPKLDDFAEYLDSNYIRVNKLLVNYDNAFRAKIMG